MASLEKKRALVTGAASGIGRATALRLAEHGAAVAVADMDETSGKRTVKEIEAAGGQGFYHHADVADPASVDLLFAAIRDRWGGLDLAFNNAGIEGETQAIEAGSIDNWDRVMAVNLRGVWLCLRQEVALLGPGGGSIVNCASVAGLTGLANASAYVASKHGLVGLTRTAALEGAPRGIRVNAVCPGAIKTPMLQRYHHDDPKAIAALEALHPLGRLGESEEIADAVLWLLSDQSSFVTGQAIAVDGGWTMH